MEKTSSRKKLACCLLNSGRSNCRTNIYCTSPSLASFLNIVHTHPWRGQNKISNCRLWDIFVSYNKNSTLRSADLTSQWRNLLYSMPITQIIPSREFFSFDFMITSLHFFIYDTVIPWSSQVFVTKALAF